MNEDHDRYVKLEQKYKVATRWWVIGAFVVASLGSLGGWVVVNTNEIVTSRGAELTKTAQNTAALVAENKELKTVATKLTQALDSSQSETSAAIGALVALSSTNHSQTTQILTSLCRATPGCTLPAPSG